MNRKSWLKTIGLSGVAVASGPFTILKPDQRQRKSERVLRIAHMTDPHLDMGDQREEWTKICLNHIHQLRDQPDLIFNGGDTINDALGREEESVENQWAIWRDIEKEADLPFVHCIGNHDVWGISTAINDQRYAKAWAVSELGIDNRYYDFERAGWHFIVLDSTHLKDDGGWYTAKLDEAQFDWLENKLQSIESSTPIFIMSHIPIVSAASFFDGDNEQSGNWQIPGAWVHIDARRIVELFHKHANVKACVSGHLHLLDKVVYNNVTYLCNGAVSGNWWKGDYHQTPAGYAVINLFEDGSVEREYVAYGWEA